MMFHRKAPFQASILALGWLLFTSSHAQGPGQPQWGLGVIAGTERQAYRDFDDKAEALPLVFYESQRVRFVGDTLDLKLPAAGAVSWRIRMRYAGEGYEAADSPYLQGMAERQGGFWMGGSASWRTS
jgi:outer membrane protein